MAETERMSLFVSPSHHDKVRVAAFKLRKKNIAMKDIVEELIDEHLTDLVAKHKE